MTSRAARKKQSKRQKRDATTAAAEANAHDTAESDIEATADDNTGRRAHGKKRSKTDKVAAAQTALNDDNEEEVDPEATAEADAVGGKKRKRKAKSGNKARPKKLNETELIERQSKFDNDFLQLVQANNEPAFDDHWVLVICRVSGPCDEFVQIKTARASRNLFIRLQPHLDEEVTTSNEQILAVCLPSKPSSEALIIGRDDPGTRVNKFLTAALLQIPNGARVDIFVRSHSGLTTDFANLGIWVEDLIDDRHFTVSLCMWSAVLNPYRDARCVMFTRLFTPIREGRLGYAAFINTEQLTSVYTTDALINNMRRCFGLVNSFKIGENRRQGAPSYRNTLTKQQKFEFGQETMFSRLLFPIE